VTAPEGRASAIIPDWLVNLAALGWRVIAIAALVVVAWELAALLWTVTSSIAIAIVVAAAFAPFALRLRAQGRSRMAAAAIVWAVALGVLGGAMLLLSLVLLPYLAQVVARATDGIAALSARLAELNIPPIIGQDVQQALDAIRAIAGAMVGDLVASAVGVVTVVILAAFLVFFFLKDGDKAWVWIFQAVSDQKRERITDAGEDALVRVGGYLRGTTILSAIIALTDLVFMLLLGVPLAVPLAVLVFFCGYIPYFGGIITTFLIFLVTYATLGIGPVVVMVLMIVVRNAILSYGVRPAVYGRTVSIHPALVLVALPAGFQVAGVVGLFAAVPVTAVLLAVAGATVAIVDPGPEPELPALVPAWLDRIAQWSWRLLVGLGLIGLVVLVTMAVPMVVVPVVLATILAATLDPLVRILIRRGRRQGQAAAIAVGGGFLAITGLMVLVFASLVKHAGALGLEVSGGAGMANDAAGGALGLLASAVEAGGVELVRTAASVASAVGSAVVVLVLSVLLTFYFLKDGGHLWNRTLARVRPEAQGAVDEAGSRAFEVLSGYMIGTGAISLVGATSQLVIMLLLGIPLALPIFVLSFFLCFIPYIGGFISTGLAFLVTVAVGSTQDIAIMAIWTIAFNLVTGNIVSPLVYGKTVHLHPAVVLVAIPAGSAIGGIMGMFLVVPFLGIVATVWRTVLAIIGLPRLQEGAVVPVLPVTDAAADLVGGPAADVAMPPPATPVPQPAEGG
jgi:predicted PurR-regulated permease PerM